MTSKNKIMTSKFYFAVSSFLNNNTVFANKSWAKIFKNLLDHLIKIMIVLN